MNNQWETILMVNGEDGRVGLLGKEEDSKGKWIFRKALNEEHDTLAEEKYPVVESWDEAMKLLDEDQWYMGIPQTIHDHFREEIFAEVKRKLNVKDENALNQLTIWAKSCFSEYAPEVVTLALWLQHAEHTTVLTGAGMSTESGIPDFRSKSGVWKNIDPASVATVDALYDDYDLFNEFYTSRVRALKDTKPHKGHEILADWEKKGLVQAVATQNVDGFHSMAGSENVFELHGTIHRMHCESCSKEATREQFFNKEACSECGGMLRPSIVLFGEMLPEDSWTASFSHIQQSDLVIVIGTSLQVHPVNRLPEMTDGKTVYINLEGNAGYFDLVIRGKAGEVLKQVDECMGTDLLLL